MTDADYAALLALLREHLFKATEADYIVSGHSTRRWAFDHLWAVPYDSRSEWFNRGIYAYLDDDHIHTALKRAIKEMAA
jgi:hypothetical protein